MRRRRTPVDDLAGRLLPIFQEFGAGINDIRISLDYGRRGRRCIRELHVRSNVGDGSVKVPGASGIHRRRRAA